MFPEDEMHDITPQDPTCPYGCEDGWLEVYPPHDADAYLPTGAPVVKWEPCPFCNVALPDHLTDWLNE